MDNQDVISTLNELIETCKDGEATYKTCTEHAIEHDSHLQSAFSELEHSCSTASSELQGMVVMLGGIPHNGRSTSEALHRGWVNLKIAFAGKNDEAILNECERGEDAAKVGYNVALGHDLPPEVRTIVERQSRGVLVNHERIRALRDHSAI
jgi:uncharacterized protein (TIGR02284 family)